MPNPHQSLTQTGRSISTHGQNLGPSVFDSSSHKPGLFGTGYYTPSTNPNPYQWGASSPLPQQISQQTATPTMTNPNKPKESNESKSQTTEEQASESVKPTPACLPAYTKGSSSRYITSGTGGKEDVSWIEQVPVKKLETV